jgi:undecaprenyl diphosphate synthase
MNLNHVAFIPDGNRRWAKKHLLESWKGHERGVARFEELLRFAFDSGVQYATFWVASEDNLTKRSKEEIGFLVNTLIAELRRLHDSSETMERGTRVRIIGRGVKIVENAELAGVVHAVEQKTAGNTKKFLTILFGYDGRTDIIHAINELRDTTYELRAESVAKALLTKELPEVDLVVRTGGEPHNSAGFLMWQTANSQLYFTETLWPDFDVKELRKAFDDFSGRERRHGK